MTQVQLNLFAHVSAAYADAPAGALDNATLYQTVASRAGLDDSEIEVRVPIGTAGTMRSPVKRQIRWYQQTLKQLGVIERVEGERGIWRLTEHAGKSLHKALQGVKLVAFSTDLGIAVWARSQDLFGPYTEPTALCYTSLPYPLRQARAYGHPGDARGEEHYVDFVCELLEPIVRNLVRGGSIVINVSNDIFLKQSPARSLYIERLILALHDRLGLSLMDREPWINYSKPPAPTYWACVKRVHLTTAYEPIYWFCNDPLSARADNRRVLQPHTDRHQRLMESGGAHRAAVYGDGAYRLRHDSFGRITEGKIPRNVIERGHRCPDTIAYRKHAIGLGLPLHGAMQPTSIADFYIRFLTEPGDLVVDTCGGTVKTGLAAERAGRRWMVAEWIVEYLRGAAELFRDFAGYSMHPALASVGGYPDQIRGTR
jgi:DNA modification methylase